MKKFVSMVLALGVVAAMGITALAEEDTIPTTRGSRGKNVSADGTMPSRAELTDEQKAEMLVKMQERLAQRLADGKITQEEYNAAIAAIESGEIPERTAKGGEAREAKEKVELTDEQKAEMLAKMQERLAQSLTDGKITQEEYDTAIVAIESGEMPARIGKGGGHGTKEGKAA